ncbi:MAG: MmcQ/YjbR family DNA-binding protein [Clostridia bacterium]|nr:MmcQ/YjbR family DNA-binding protein [Clostridia bacterium]
MDKDKIDKYLLSFLGIKKDYKEEWGWDRYLLEDKMIAAICTNKIGEEIITLKCDPAFGIHLRSAYDDISPGYYMNKLHWNSVKLNGKVPDDVIKEMIDQSYDLIFNGFSKKEQSRIKNVMGQKRKEE